MSTWSLDSENMTQKFYTTFKNSGHTALMTSSWGGGWGRNWHGLFYKPTNGRTVSVEIEMGHKSIKMDK